MNKKGKTTSEIVLEKFRIMFPVAFSEEYLGAIVDVRSCYKPTIDEVVYQFNAWFASSKEEVVECKWPKDWWQAFRERWFWKWWLKRWPVKYKHRILEARVIYPNMEVPKQKWVPNVSLRYGDDDYSWGEE